MGSAELMLILGVILTGVAVYLVVSVLLGSNNDKNILSWANNEEPKKSKNFIINTCRPLVHQITLRYAVKFKDPAYRKRIERIIKSGGLSEELNVDEFIGYKLFLGVAFPAFMLLMNFTLELGFAPIVLIALGGVGYFMPEMHANKAKKDRELSVRADMPFFVDLLALSVEAGLDFFSAIQKIVDKSNLEESVLANEFNLVLKDVKVGAAKSQALTEMAQRLDMPEMTSFVAVLVDAEATGASISQVLKDQATQMRLERFVRAEKAGARASQAIMLPLMLFILPAVFIMVFGPVAISMMYGGGK